MEPLAAGVGRRLRCARNVGRRFADRAQSALAQHGAHSSASVNAVRLARWRASLRDIRPPAERRLPLNVLRHGAPNSEAARGRRDGVTAARRPARVEFIGEPTCLPRRAPKHRHFVRLLSRARLKVCCEDARDVATRRSFMGD